MPTHVHAVHAPGTEEQGTVHPTRYDSPAVDVVNGGGGQRWPSGFPQNAASLATIASPPSSKTSASLGVASGMDGAASLATVASTPSSKTSASLGVASGMDGAASELLEGGGPVRGASPEHGGRHAQGGTHPSSAFSRHPHARCNAGTNRISDENGLTHHPYCAAVCQADPCGRQSRSCFTFSIVRLFGSYAAAAKASDIFSRFTLSGQFESNRCTDRRDGGRAEGQACCGAWTAVDQSDEVRSFEGGGSGGVTVM